MGPHSERNVVTEEEGLRRAVTDDAPGEQELRQAGKRLAAGLSWIPGEKSADLFAKRCQELSTEIKTVLERASAQQNNAQQNNLQQKNDENRGRSKSNAEQQPDSPVPVSVDVLWLRDNADQLLTATKQLSAELGPLADLPVVISGENTIPRIIALTLGFVAHAGVTFSKSQFVSFCLGFEDETPLEFHEIGALVPVLRLTMLERIAEKSVAVVRGGRLDRTGTLITCIQTFRYVTQTSWKDELEALIPFDGILSQDPTGTYSSMDVVSRNVYRERVARIARRSDRTEMEVAETALSLAKRAQQRKVGDARVAYRESHIGYYLIGEGSDLLYREVGFHPSVGERVRASLRGTPNEVLLSGIVLFTLAIVTGAVWILTPAETPPLLVLLSIVMLSVPASQAAVELMNYLITNLLPAESLPKLDFSKGIPADCVTLVAIPTLLFNEEQVCGLVEALEVRFLGNHDPNLHFAIVSDLPDSLHSPSEENALIALCSRLIEELNAKYAAKNEGSFFHLHRHRVYNPRERKWMGWERKRGKLLDLNQLLRGHYDSFPVKCGDLPILSTVRYVITLDADTELPRGSAHRMIGAIAHPLNQAIIDPGGNIVVAGYGILQPRVGISVSCASRSRLAAIFAGETGLDPYTRAVSDVYQDLYGEATFTGKGIYEVDTLLQVLKGRFPENSLLSHDLIEGAYARVGLVTDIEVIEDYPTHYSAYNRRKHRWLRGDWQIMEWLLDTVPDESGARVPNPISLVSRWKILDNLRRSLVEPATFALFLFGWFVMSHAVWWTIFAASILFLSTWVEFAVGIGRAIISRRISVARDACSRLIEAGFTSLLTLTLLAYQTILSLDAVGRALTRRLITRERLLEWETAAEAEMGQRRARIDRYMDWMPWLAVGLGLVVWLTRPDALVGAIPILALWVCSKRLALWLNKSPLDLNPRLDLGDARFLRRSALHIWRYFAEFSNQEHNWLVPDNVEERPLKVTATVSPTNVGLLLNVLQAANELGHLTLPEMVDRAQKTLDTVAAMPKHRGHLMNWYDTRTITAKTPLFISSVDSGNLVASLWTLREGCFDYLRRPLLSRSLVEGLLDHARALTCVKGLPKPALSRLEQALRGEDWLLFLLEKQEGHFEPETASMTLDQPDAAWFKEQVRLRVMAVHSLVSEFMPWLLPEFAPLRAKLYPGEDVFGNVTLGQLPQFIADLQARLDSKNQASWNGNRSAADRLRMLLSRANENALHLIAELQNIIQQTHDLAEAMDFEFLVDKQRLLLSVGFDVRSEQLVPYSYDLLATEPRTAVFVAIAKEDIPQDCWFRLDRTIVSDGGHPVLLSWTGTMFEYLMPTIWMRSYPNTLLDRGNSAAVRSQQTYSERKGIPWGISESACATRNVAGDYHYEAFGVPTLARKKSDSDPLIVSPYSTLLALNVDREGSLANLRRMESLGWFGQYGFYEAADYTNSRRRFRRPQFEIVRSWMAHHMGMSLLALTNCLCNNIFQEWFHADPRVQATELLLQEKPILHSV